MDKNDHKVWLLLLVPVYYIWDIVQQKIDIVISGSDDIIIDNQWKNHLIITLNTKEPFISLRKKKNHLIWHCKLSLEDGFNYDTSNF